MLADNDTHGYGGGANGTYNFFLEDQFIAILKHRAPNQTNMGYVVKALEDFRSRYNISVVKECEKSEYCSGEFRDLILAYNSIHGYVSLLVSFQQFILLCAFCSCFHSHMFIYL